MVECSRTEEGLSLTGRKFIENLKKMIAHYIRGQYCAARPFLNYQI